MDTDHIYKIIDKLIEDLPDEIKDVKKPVIIDLVLDGGVFNGSYLIGALYFLKEMEKRNFVKIKRISGCSIGSLIGFLYIIDRLDLVINLYHTIVCHFKENYNFKIYKDLKRMLDGSIPIDICSKVNNRLFIKYNNIQKGLQKVKCVYKNEDDIINTIIRSSFFPYLIDGNIAHKDKYLDGFNPYFFKPRFNRKILFLDLSGLNKITCMFNVKNEKTNFYRIMSGILDIYIFFTKQSETFMCSYVDEWNYLNKIRFYIRLFLEKIICCVSYFVVLIKKYIDIHLINTISYKFLSNILYEILIIIIKKYCL